MEKLLIAHRGNVSGRQEERENKPEYILRALTLGYDVEIDVWGIGDELYLGHDNPQYIIDYWFLKHSHLWIHCKNIEAMYHLSGDSNLNLFAHKDDIVITTKGYLWTAPLFPLTKRSIAVMPEFAPDWDISLACGVCTDYPAKYNV